MTTARQSIAAAREAIRAVEELLLATRVRFQAGLATSYDVLGVLDTLSQARTRELRALMEHNIAQAALQVAEGSKLEEYNVEVRGSSAAGNRGSF